MWLKSAEYGVLKSQPHDSVTSFMLPMHDVPCFVLIILIMAHCIYTNIFFGVTFNFYVSKFSG